MADTTYQPKVYMRQGAGSGQPDTQVIASGGQQVVESGGAVDFESGSNLSFLGQDIDADTMLGLAKQGAGAVTIGNSAGTLSLMVAGGSAPVVLPSEYAMIVLSVAAAMSNGSARLPSAKAGQELLIRYSAVGASVCSLIILCAGHTSGVAGAAVYASTGSVLSQITMRQSAASYAQLRLKAVADGQWSIVTAYGDITEVPA